MILATSLNLMSLVNRSVFACTVLYASDGKVALAGNNEDAFNPFTKIWFLPPAEGKHGRVYLGFDNFFPQGGMNERGLFFGYTAADPLKVLRSKNKERYNGNLMDKVMEECAGVEEALRMFGKYDLQFMRGNQTFIGDGTGDSAIIEGDIILRKSGKYQVLSNFRQSKAKPGKYPCERYNIALEMLGNSNDISVDLFRRILAATHSEIDIPTIYSGIYELKRRIVYLYHFHNFENVVEIELDKELRKGRHSYDLPSLFPRTFAAEVFEQRVLAEVKKRKATHIDPKIYDTYVGQYRVSPETKVAPGLVITVTKEKNKLYMGSWLAPEGDEILPESEDHFIFIGFLSLVELRFIRDRMGQVNRLIIAGSGWKIAAQRIL